MRERRVGADEEAVLQIFGGNVARRRERLGVTRAECAERAGIGLSELASLEAGVGEVGAFTVARVARALGCDIGELIGDIRWVPPSTEEGRGRFELD